MSEDIRSDMECYREVSHAMLPEEVGDWLLASADIGTLTKRLAYCIPHDSKEHLKAVSKTTGLGLVELRRIACGVVTLDSITTVDKLLIWACPGYSLLPRAPGADAGITVPDRVKLQLGKLEEMATPVENQRVLNKTRKGECLIRTLPNNPDEPVFKRMEFLFNGEPHVCLVDDYHKVKVGSVRKLPPKPPAEPKRKLTGASPSWDAGEPPVAT